MPVETKIAEAERWFKKIEQSYPNEQLELRDNVNAFLSAINSIPDHLLEEYNVKFNLAIPVNATSFRREFTNRVKQMNDPTLSEFYSWFEAKRKFVEKEDKICSTLSQKRHVNTHRFTTSPTIHAAQFHFSIPPMDLQLQHMESRLQPHVKPGNKVIKICSKRPKKITRLTLKPDSSSLDIFFEELNEVNVKDACKHMLYIMKNLVTETHEKFPIM